MMAMYWRRRLTRLEAALYGSIAAVLIAFLADRLLDTIELAERTAMEMTLSRVTSGINNRIAQEWLRGEWTPRSRLLQRNPFELAGVTPSNYAGEASGAAPESGTWTYDAARRELVYSPRVSRGLAVADGAGPLRFRVVPARAGPGVVVEPITPYTWQ